MCDYSRSIEFGEEVKQFLAIRIRGVTLEQMIANAAHRDTLRIDTTQWEGK